MPDTLLTAARKVSQIAAIPWGRVVEIYRDLQRVDLLPTSRGRAICLATPRDVGMLLLAIAVAHCCGLRPSGRSALVRILDLAALPGLRTALTDLVSGTTTGRVEVCEIGVAIFRPDGSSELFDTGGRHEQAVFGVSVLDAELWRTLSAAIDWGDGEVVHSGVIASNSGVSEGARMAP